MERFENINFRRDINNSIEIEQNDNVFISKQISEEFDIYDVPFLGCNYETIYSRVANILPKEKIEFKDLSFEECIACEVVCAAICHQMNWDYLRQAVLKKTLDDKSWLYGERLANISHIEVSALFSNYEKIERIKSGERCKLLRGVGKTIIEIGSYKNLFFDEKQNLLPIDKIRKNLLKSEAFFKDPKEKKLQLLLQKLSVYDGLQNLSIYCKPAIDYHLIRCYLRRGLIYPRTKFASEFIFDSSIQRKETTVGALRQLCSELLEQISWYTGLDICVVNAIEWHIGRSICTQDIPDCYLESEDATWLKKAYLCCPFYENCHARQSEKEGMLYINEPEYKGTSY